MVVLDTFGRIGVRISVHDLNSLLENESHPEVRSAALYYLRAFLKRNDTEYFALFNQFRENYHHRAPPSSLFSAQLDALSSELSPKGSKP
jgi:hypothetical protein